MSMLKLLLQSPMIASCKNEQSLNHVLELENLKLVFVLYGNICNVASIVQKLKDAGKTAYVHLDLIEGLSSDEIVVEFIRNNTSADGVISTKAHLVKAARKQNMSAILRTFIVDSFSYHNVVKQVAATRPDAVEILPGVLNSSIKELSSEFQAPIIAGGMVCEQELVLGALNSGAYSVSTTNEDMWRISNRLYYDDSVKRMCLK